MIVKLQFYSVDTSVVDFIKQCNLFENIIELISSNELNIDELLIKISKIKDKRNKLNLLKLLVSKLASECNEHKELVRYLVDF